jgi:hypothetical protein
MNCKSLLNVLQTCAYHACRSEQKLSQCILAGNKMSLGRIAASTLLPVPFFTRKQLRIYCFLELCDADGPWSGLKIRTPTDDHVARTSSQQVADDSHRSIRSPVLYSHKGNHDLCRVYNANHTPRSTNSTLLCWTPSS